MSARYPGGFITKTPTAPTSLAAPGIWTLDQAMQNQLAGNWPAPPPKIYIEDLFSTWLYTGDGVGGAINNNINLSAYGGMVWTKGRSLGYDNWLLDTARSLSNGPIKSNSTDAQLGFTYGISSWLTTGYYTTNDSAFQNSGTTFVSWAFRKQEKFFDVVTWTGNGTNRTIAHSLGSVPGCILVKRLDTSSGWRVYHRSLANTEALALNDTGAKTTSATYWNSTTATSSVFSLGTDGNVNANTSTYVAYLFAHDAGGFGASGSDNVVSCGTFTTNASSVGTATLGYEPQWVLIKSVGNDPWLMFDDMRGFFNGGQDALLQPNSANTEGSSYSIATPTATGFVTDGSTPYIAASTTYIYIAIRRGPMKVPTVGTNVFLPITNSNSTGTTQTTGFRVDAQIETYRPGTTVNSFFVDRLRPVSTTPTGGGEYLISSATDAASTATYETTQYWKNASFQTPAFYGGSSAVYWSFQRAPSYFDAVCYTGTGSNTTQTHNLGVIPELIIVKRRDTTADWDTYCSALANTEYVVLNTTAAKATGATRWNSTTPTASVFSIGTSTTTNASAGTYVAYLFATCAGVSKVGTYTGTGALLTVNCGFTSSARLVLIKRTDSTGGWYGYDSARGISSGTDPYLFLNDGLTGEVTGTNYVDTDTTGFKVTAAAPAGLNASGGTYIFLAIA